EHRVVIVRRAAEQPVLALRDLLDRGSHVPLYRGRVGVGGPHRDADRLAVHLQRIETVLPHEGLGVGELVVIERGVGPVAAALERRGHPPARGQGEANFGRSLELPLLVEKYIGAEKLPEVTRDACEREVDRVGEVVERRRHGIAPARRHAPGVLVQAVPEQWLAPRVLRAEVPYVAGVVLDLVAAGAPRRKGHDQPVLAARWKLGAHVEQTRRRRWNRYFVLDRRWRLCGQRNGDEQHEQVAHERLRRFEGVTTTPRKTKRPRRLVGAAGMRVASGWLQGVTRSLASATMARNSLLGLKTGTGRAATSTGSPVRGLRAMRVLRWRILNVPNPRISMLCCSDSAALTASRKESTTRAQSFLEIKGPAVRAICAVTFSTRSAFVIRPP